MPEKPAWNLPALNEACALLKQIGELQAQQQQLIGRAMSLLLQVDRCHVPPAEVRAAAAVPRPLPIETLARIEDTASRLKLGGQVAQAVQRAGARHLRELTPEQAAALIAWLDKQASSREMEQGGKQP